MTKVLIKSLQARNRRVARTDCGVKLRNGNTCHKNAGEGTAHPGWGKCARHGGNEPRGVSEAALAESQYLQRTFATSVATDPAQALVDELSRTNGAVQFLQLEIDADARQAILDGENALDHLTTPRMQMVRKMYDQERDRLTRLSAACLNLGIKEREVRLAEQMGWVITSVLEKTLADLHLTPEQRDSARPIMAAHLQSAAHTVVEGHVVHGIPSRTG